jgi:lipoprotein-anchoring transpeptidase ErfK/SrfK
VSRRRVGFGLAALFLVTSCGRGAPPGDLPAAPSTSPSPSTAPFAVVDAAIDIGPETAPPPAEKPRLGARGQIVYVLAEPRPGSAKLGYLRAGAVVERDEKPSAEEGCKKGWYGIRPRGFVCVGDLATIDMDDPVVKAASRRPDRDAPLPYAYGIARNTLAPFYARIPTHAESLKLESELDDHLKWYPKQHAAALADAGPEFDATVFMSGPDGGVTTVFGEGPPWFLADGKAVPNVSGWIKSPRALWAGRPKTKEGFAIVASFTSGPGGTPPTGGPEDRRFDLTTDYLLIPHDRLREVRPSAFRGLVLDDKVTLPVGFVRPRHRTTKMWLGENKAETLATRTAVPLSGQSKRIDGVDWWGTTDGAWVKAEDTIRVEPPKSWPAFANKGEKWIDVSIARQSLTAYEGTKPVYVTLVSTGRDGLGDPESSFATVRGVYRIHTKHVTITMDSTESGEEFSLRDVPYVQYFETGYALHGAYWHDGFGEPRSHGCVNLPEWDAMWLFKWTGPDVPDEWHAAMAKPLATGTAVWIHP